MTIPNIMSIIRIILVAPAGYYLWNGHNVVCALIMIFASFLDIFDGIIARKFNQISELGKILDPLADKMFFIMLAIILSIQNVIPVWFFIAVVARDVLLLLGGLYASSKLKFVIPANYVGKLTATTIAVNLLFIVLGLRFSIDYMIYFTTLLMLWSLIYYLIGMLKQFKAKGV